MATRRALEGPEPLARFVELTKMIRDFEKERDGLKGTIVEALQHEPPSGSNGEQYVGYNGLRVELCSRARWKYSGDVARLEADLRALKTTERANGSAELQGHTAYTKCTVIRSRSEAEARERKASAIASTLAAGGLSAPEVQGRGHRREACRPAQPFREDVAACAVEAESAEDRCLTSLAERGLMG